MNCNNCGSDDIILEEYMGAFDGRLSLKCEDCKKEYHRCGMEIMEKHQVEPYGPMYFTLIEESGKLLYYKNLYKIE